MTTKPMYDALLSSITSRIVTWKRGSDGKVMISFAVDGETDSRGRTYWRKRVIQSRYFSNHSVDTVRYNNKRYLIDSRVELLEARQ